MTSAYSPLGVELMVTGENAGTWGTKTNTNLNIVEQISGGYLSVAVNGTGNTDIVVSDGAATTGNQVAHRVIELTGTITGNITVSIPLDVENFYFIKNSTSGVKTVEFQYVTGSGTSVTWATGSKTWKLISAKADDAVNPNLIEMDIDTTASPGGTTGQVQVNSSGAFGAISEGTTGYLLTSTGVGTSPTFQVNSATSTGKAIAMAMIFG
tara:strand:+ start:33 stop:662 length:630 start_codon:yes stop_codon:yes gene_type:complete